MALLPVNVHKLDTSPAFRGRVQLSAATVDADGATVRTPIEKAYEHGFYPLKGGFKAQVEENFEIVSQWIEVLPTDRLVPVEVKYDPISGPAGRLTWRGDDTVNVMSGAPWGD